MATFNGIANAVVITGTATGEKVSAGAGHTVAVEVTHPARVIMQSPDDKLTVVHGKSTGGQLPAHDADAENYSFSIATGPRHGTVVFTDDSGSYVYHADDYVGDDSFTVRFAGGFGGSADHHVDAQTTNSDPVLDAQGSTGFYSAVYGTATAGAIVAIDTDGDMVTFTLKSAPQSGEATADSHGRFTSSTAAGAANVDAGTGTPVEADASKMPWAISVTGSSFNDLIHGDASTGVLKGVGGYDTIFSDGGHGVRDGSGKGIPAGDPGANTCVWEHAGSVDAGGTPASLDRITDFGAGDRLDFSGIVAPAEPIGDAIRITGIAGGLAVEVDMGGTSGFVDLVVLDNVHGLTVEDLTHSGAIAV